MHWDLVQMPNKNNDYHILQPYILKLNIVYLEVLLLLFRVCKF